MNNYNLSISQSVSRCYYLIEIYISLSLIVLSALLQNVCGAQIALESEINQMRSFDASHSERSASCVLHTNNCECTCMFDLFHSTTAVCAAIHTCEWPKFLRTVNNKLRRRLAQDTMYLVVDALLLSLTPSIHTDSLLCSTRNDERGVMNVIRQFGSAVSNVSTLSGSIHFRHSQAAYRSISMVIWLQSCVSAGCV